MYFRVVGSAPPRFFQGLSCSSSILQRQKYGSKQLAGIDVARLGAEVSFQITARSLKSTQPVICQGAEQKKVWCAPLQNVRLHGIQTLRDLGKRLLRSLLVAFSSQVDSPQIERPRVLGVVAYELLDIGFRFFVTALAKQ